MATPGEPYPLNKSPFPNAPFRRPLAECVFSHVFFIPNGAGSVITCAPTLGAHAAHPSFWDPGWQLKISKMHQLSKTATGSPHLRPKCSLTAPLERKMSLLGGFGCPVWPPKCDCRPLLRTHYLVCLHCKMNILRRLWTLWERSLQHCPHLAPSGTNFLPLQSLPGSIWRLKWVA